MICDSQQGFEVSLLHFLLLWAFSWQDKEVKIIGIINGSVTLNTMKVILTISTHWTMLIVSLLVVPFLLVFFLPFLIVFLLFTVVPTNLKISGSFQERRAIAFTCTYTWTKVFSQAINHMCKWNFLFISHF